MPIDPSMHHELRDHGRTLAVSLGLAHDVGNTLADSLLSQYQRWPRRYHDARHLLACVRAAESVRAVAPSPDAVAFALWFHDAVYWPWRHDNELRSAQQARDSALRLGLGGAFAERVHRLVMATAHLSHRGPPLDDPAAAWVLDIDLGILGTAPAVYDQYERDVRREYFFVTPWAWRKGRAAVLRHFLDQATIYRTDHFRRALEEPARQNMERALARLAA